VNLHGDDSNQIVLPIDLRQFEFALQKRQKAIATADAFSRTGH
jgi:hypothetical protein